MQLLSPRRHRRVPTLIAALALLAGAIAVTTNLTDTPSAVADTAPAPATGMPSTFSALPLPTVQVNGIVWAQVTVGNTVYATGNFTHSRPAGAAPNTQLSPAGNILAYDITTGERITTFDHTLNGAGRSLAVSPDGTRVYVGGDFTTVDGQLHVHIAAFNTADHTLDATFNAKTGSTVMAIVPTPTTVYAGGSMISAGSTPGPDIPRTNLAAFDATTGALLPWAPTANGVVQSMVMAPAGDKLVVSGQFNTLNGTTAVGMGAVDATTGATLPWLANTRIRNSTTSSVMGLSTDGVLIYGGGAAPSTATGNFEGRFAADPADGSLVWANACHGDTYATLPVNGALYSAGHSHDCTAIGAYNDWSFPGEQWHHVQAESTFATGVNTGPDPYGASWNFAGTPAASLLTWFPSLTAAARTPSGMPAGTVAVSGMSQAAWSLTTNTAGTFLAVGGEFASAGFKPQQGLTRFALPSATNASGPVYAVVAPPNVVAGPPGTATVTWNAAWDRDSESLTYEIFRDGASAPLTTQVMRSTFWSTGATGNLVDTGLTAGPHTYLLKVTDPDGNWVKKSTSVMIATGGSSQVASTNLALGRPTSTSGLYSNGWESWRAVDGNTDGSLHGGSMAISRSSAQSWWQVDLQSSSRIQNIEVFGRTDCCADQSSGYWVFVSDTPLDTRLTPAQQADRPGVWSAFVDTAGPVTNLTLPVGTSGRYVMVRHGGTNHLSLAEVRVTGLPPVPPVVDTQPPTVPTGITATQAGTTVDVAWTASTDLPDPGGVGIAGYYVIRDYTTQWFVPAGTHTFADTTVTLGTHRYQVRAVDRGSRLSPNSAITTVNVTDPSAVVDTQPPTTPTGVTATQAGTSVNVAWTASTDLPDPGGVGIAGYYVIRDYTTQWFVPAGTTYTDTMATPGTHRYQVRAVDRGSRLSPASAIATVNVTDPNAVVDTQPPTVPTGIAAARNGTAIVVSWEASTDLPDPGGVGVAGYYVIRDWTTQWFVPAGTLTFTDADPPAGTHRYQVRAVDRGSRLSANPTPVVVPA